MDVPSPTPDGAGHAPARPTALRAIWDLPTRLCHWVLAAGVLVCLYTGLTGGLRVMDWHMRSGYVVLGALFFRVAWGFAGTCHARFASFLRGPRHMIAYGAAALRGRPPPSAGHNPLGGWATVLMLLVLAAQAATGLFASDDIMTEGPLVYYVDDAVSDGATTYHHVGKWLVGGVIALHLAALALHRFAWGEHLLGAMITGRKEAPADALAHGGHRLIRAMTLAAVAAAGVYLLVTR